MKKNFKLLICSLSLAALWTACTKPGTEPEPEPQGPDYSVVPLLNEGSGYEQIWDTVMSISSVGIPGRMGITDFTLEGDNRLNFVWYSYWKSQQDGFFNMHKRSYDMSTKTLIPQPQNSVANEANLSRSIPNAASSQTITLDMEKYKPYTNFYAEGFRVTNSSGGFSTTNAQFHGDISAGFNTYNGYAGSIDMSFRNPVVNFMSEYSERPLWFGANTGGDIDYLATVHNARPYYAVPSGVRFALPEARKSNNNFCIIFLEGMVRVYQIFPKDSASAVVPSVELTSLSGPIPGNFTKCIRHYNEDGSILSFLIYDGGSKTYYSYVYNSNTQTLQQVLNNVSLSYGDNDQSDMDIDEQGNLYYTGYAANGSNTAGISIYKISAGGGHTLVGGDNIVKFGQFIKLKYLKGRVYCVLTGTKTGQTDVHQLSIIRQQ